MRQSLLLLLFVFLCGEAIAQLRIPESRPRLVLFLVADELNNEQLGIIRSKCTDYGFNRIVSGGAQFKSAGYLAGSVFSGRNMASLYTGAYPATHGIISRNWINRFNGIETDALYGQYTHQRLDTVGKTPSNSLLLSTTLADELQRIHNGQSKIFAVGFHPENLIWSTSSHSDPVFWIDLQTGKMTGTESIYNRPERSWVKNFNQKNLASLYQERIWAPLTDIQEYHEWRFYPAPTPRTFYYPLKNPKDTYPFQRVAGSPYGNSMVRDFAANLILSEQLGKDDVPDMLTLEFTLRPSVHRKSLPLDAESEDLLLRLDREIESLLTLIDQEVGLHHTLIVFTAAQSPAGISQSLRPYNKPKGVFNITKASSLLNLYLMALHGQGKWVLSQKSGEIYLNNELIAKSKIDRNTLLQQACGFLLQVEGIANAMSSADLTTGNTIWTTNKNMLLNYHLKRSGDIIFCLEPGWAEELPTGQLVAHSWEKEWVPLSLYGWRISRQTILTPTDLTTIAPTLSLFLEIGTPNGSEGKALDGLLP